MTLAGLVRAREWWSYKIPPLLAVAYAIAFVGGVEFHTGAVAIAAFVLFLVATASFGYFLNDVCDIEADHAAGKPNAAAELSGSVRFVVLVGLVGLVAAPWLALPHSLWLAALVLTELALFVAYAAPPIRLKARGAPALVADALYAHTLPMLLAVTTFAAVAELEVPGWVTALVAAWSFLVGFRGILLHQIDDLRADAEAGVRTAVTEASRLRAVSLIAGLSLPVEVALFAALSLVVSHALPFFGLYTLMIVGSLVARVLREVARRRREDPAPASETEDDARFRRRRSFADYVGAWVLNDFYEKWMPLFPLLLLTVTDPVYGVVGAAHVLAFRSALAR